MSPNPVPRQYVRRIVVSKTPSASSETPSTSSVRPTPPTTCGQLRAKSISKTATTTGKRSHSARFRSHRRNSHCGEPARLRSTCVPPGYSCASLRRFNGEPGRGRIIALTSDHVIGNRLSHNAFRQMFSVHIWRKWSPCNANASTHARNSSSLLMRPS